MPRNLTLHSRNIRRVAVAMLAELIVFGVAAQQPKQALTRSDLTFEVALTLKSTADEMFLMSSPLRATRLYDEALAETRTLDATWVNDHRELVLLLQADIEYRRALLEAGSDFWGGVYTLTPMNPVEAYERFKEAVENLSAVAKKIEDAKKQANLAGADANYKSALREQSKTELDAQALEKVASEIRATYHAEKTTTIEERLDNIYARQQELVSERQQLSAQFDQLQKQLDGMVLQGVMSAAGLPPDLASVAASDKPLQEKVLAIGKSMLVNNKTELGKAFAGMSDETARLAQAVAKIDQTVQDADRLNRAAQSAGAAIRSGTIEGALQAGTLVFQQLPADEQRRLIGTVNNQIKPVVALVETASRVDETRKALGKFVANQGDMRNKLFQVLAERAADNSPAFDVWYRNQLKQLTATVSSQEEEYRKIEMMLQAWPSAFYARLPEDIRGAIKQRLGAVDDTVAVNLLKDNWPPAGMNIALQGQTATFSLSGKSATFEYRDFVSQQVTRPIDVISNYAERAAAVGEVAARSAMQEQLSKMVHRVQENGGTAVLQFAENFTSLDSSSGAARLLPDSIVKGDIGGRKKESDALYDAIANSYPSSARQRAQTSVAAVQAGAIAGRAIISDLPKPSILLHVAGEGSGGSAAQAAQNAAIAKAALSAACPAAGAVFMAIDAANTLSQMASLTNRINQLAAEDRALMRERLALNDLLGDERVARALAEIGVRVSDTRQAGAIRQIASYDAATSKLENYVAKEVYAQRLFLPRAFFLAEQLRFRFDQLDRSLAFWANDPEVPRGQIAERIKTDPQWRKYALDPEIQIYRWLERDSEADRGNITTLAEEWSRKYQLASAVCDTFKCKKDTAVVGEVQLSPELSIKRLVSPGVWANFKKWQANGEGEFTFEVFLTPETLQVDRGVHLVRLVDVRFGVSRGADTVRADGARLSHPGTAYVPFGERYIREHYLPRSRPNLSWGNDMSTADLRTRWLRTWSLVPMEGYGLFTLWRISLQRDQKNTQADDFRLLFAYQFQPKERVLTDAELRQRRQRTQEWGAYFTTTDGIRLRVPLSELEMLGDASSGTIRLDSANQLSAGDRRFPNVELRRLEESLP